MEGGLTNKNINLVLLLLKNKFCLGVSFCKEQVICNCLGVICNCLGVICNCLGVICNCLGVCATCCFSLKLSNLLDLFSVYLGKHNTTL